MATRELEDERSMFVYESNDLAQKAQFRLSLTEQKFILYLASKLKPSTMEMPTFTIRTVDFCRVCGIRPENFYREFRQMILSFHEKEFWIRDGHDLKFWMWFAKITYHEREGSVTIRLSDDLSQYLLNLKKDFTMFELINALGLRSKHSLRLFQIFKSYSYREKIVFDVDDLKQLLGLNGAYENFKDFRRRVLAPALAEIGEFTELNVRMEEIRRGHRIGSVAFYITAKTPTERTLTFDRVQHLLDGANLDQMSLFDRTAHDQAETT